MINFHVGQKVVCVDASPSRYPCDFKLHKGSIYTVRGIDPENGTGIWLEEYLSKIEPPWRHERGWCPRRFRPVIERKTDISIFTALLNPKRALEPTE